MPVLNGVELVKIIREEKISVKVLVITGIGDKERVRQLERLEFNHFLQKPFSPKEITERVLMMIEK